MSIEIQIKLTHWRIEHDYKRVVRTTIFMVEDVFQLNPVPTLGRFDDDDVFASPLIEIVNSKKGSSAICGDWSAISQYVYVP